MRAAVKKPTESELIANVANRVLAYATKLIVDANHRKDKEEGDPKVGGHPAACASCVHIMSALHLGARSPADVLVNKPHGSPIDHALSYALGLFHEPFGRRWLSAEEGAELLTRFRAFSKRGEPVLQSYHAESDPDGDYFFPSGSVGIPAVASMYTALAYRYAEHHGFEAPKDAHFWSLLGDSEFREGSLMEGMPDAAERELGNVTWIVDYNRQNLDGTRMPNQRGLRGTDWERMERLGLANGWDVLQLIHGKKRQALFKRPGGKALQEALEKGFSDYGFQILLYKKDVADIRAQLLSVDKKLEKFLKTLSDAELLEAFLDLGGHDVDVLLEAFKKARQPSISPTLIIAHTIKGWGLHSLQGAPGNHNALPEDDEVKRVLEERGLSAERPYELFPSDSPEGRLLAERGASLRAGIEKVWALKDKNMERTEKRNTAAGPLPETLGVDLKMLPLVHTQYVWGQFAGKLIRIGNQQEAERKGQKQRALSDEERRWGPLAEHVLTMAPDVGTSTNINPAMDEKIYGPDYEKNWEESLGVRDRRRPGLMPHEEAWTRHLRFEIAEANAMSAVGAFGKMRDRIGIPFVPVMTIYDFFIKRAFDQLYYNLYWGSSFIVIGTPSGVTLSSEGAQHSWKSDIQMPNLITWEPFYAQEVDWILSDAVRRAYTGDNAGRTGVLVRCVTRAFRHAELLKRLVQHKRFEGWAEEDILEATRKDCLAGAYYLVDHRGQEGYEPGENVVNLFTMGAMGSEALAASDRLRQDGIFANVINVTSADLLCGNLAALDGYQHLKTGLGVTGDLHLSESKNGHSRYHLNDSADLITAAGRRVPMVCVMDGEPGLLDNLGSIVGVRAESLAVRKASKCGRPSDIYRYQHIDAESVYEACGRVLSETALENVILGRGLLSNGPASESFEGRGASFGAPLWPPRQ